MDKCTLVFLDYVYKNTVYNTNVRLNVSDNYSIYEEVRIIHIMLIKSFFYTHLKSRACQSLLVY